MADNFVEGIATSVATSAKDGGIGAHEPFAVSEGTLVLDVPRREDIPEIASACQDPEIQRFTTVAVPFGLEDAKFFVSTITPKVWSEGGASWVIRVKDGKDQHFAGTVALRNRSEKVADIGFWTDQAWRDQGLMSSAVRLAMRTAFEQLGFDCITWEARLDNLASRKVAWKCGFTFGGVVRGLGLRRAVRDDLVIASILKGDPFEPKSPWDDVENIGMNPNPRDPEALVRQFHETYNLPVVTTGPNIENERMHMRLSLIMEETSELIRALYGQKAYETMQEAINQLQTEDEHARDIVEVADALADLTYVVYGMALEAGISLPAVLKEVQDSNMSKLGKDGKPIYREDGKVLKGPGFFEPNIKRALDKKISPSM